ncbi:type 2 periplasmic-binding domain-containing protein [Halovulum sp. GXIMD14793]
MKNLFFALLISLTLPQTLLADGLRIGIASIHADADIAAAEALATEGDAILTGQAACVTEIACLEAVRHGTLDITVTGPLTVTALLPAAAAFDMPQFLPQEVLWLRLADLPALQTDGLQMFAVTPTGAVRVIATTSRRITMPEDMAGLRFYTTDSSSELLIIATGAEQVEMPRAAVFDALQVGEIDGVIMDITDLMRSNLVVAGVSYATIADHATEARLWWARDDTVSERRARMIAAAQSRAAGRSKTAEEDFVDDGGDLYRLNEAERVAFFAVIAPFHAPMIRQFPEAEAVNKVLLGE